MECLGHELLEENIHINEKSAKRTAPGHSSKSGSILSSYRFKPNANSKITLLLL
jgi:hypothetical protein